MNNTFKVGDKAIVKNWTWEHKQIKGVISEILPNIDGSALCHLTGGVKDSWWNSSDLLHLSA